MSKIRRIIAAGMVGVMGLSLCACGGAKKEKKAQVDASEEEALEEKMPEEEGNPIYIYSFDDELEEKLQYFYEMYPQYEKRVEFVNLEMGAASKEYQDTIKDRMKKGVQNPPTTEEIAVENVEDAVAGDEEGEMMKEMEFNKYPSIVANDSIMGYSFIQNDYSVPVSSLGITEEDMAQMYPYTLSGAVFQDEVKGLTWSVTPGAFMYRADIAEKVLGESSPEKVQEMLGSWEGFQEVAKKMKEAGYKMLSGSDEITYAMLQSRQTPWVLDEQLQIDTNVKKCLKLSKKLQKDDYTGDTLITSEEREASFDSDVFGWFVYPGTVYAGIDDKMHEGEFRLCQGPNAYQWGSTYLTVSPKCPDKELAALVLRTLCCNEGVLMKMAEDDYVNHRTIMETKAKEAEGLPVLGGQNPLEVWLSVENDIDAQYVTPYDGRFDSWIQELSVSYNTGRVKNVKNVLEQFKDKVSDAFNYIQVE